MQINTSSTRSILDSVATRIDEAREITRYIVNTLIFLGLLGTFYGLATTVPALVDTIRSLAPKDGEASVAVFGRLMTGLESQLSGMGVAFASSLLGLAGSLVVGILELFAGHGQNRFYRELEEWLSSITRVGFSSGEDASSEQAAMTSVLDHMSEQMETMQQMFVQSDVSRSMVDERLGQLSDSIERMTYQMQHGDAENSALERVAAGQERLIAHFESQGGGEGGSTRKVGCVCGLSMCKCCAFLKKSQPAVRKAWQSCALIFLHWLKRFRSRGQARRLSRSRTQDEAE